MTILARLFLELMVPIDVNSEQEAAMPKKSSRFTISGDLPSDWSLNKGKTEDCENIQAKESFEQTHKFFSLNLFHFLQKSVFNFNLYILVLSR